MKKSNLLLIAGDCQQLTELESMATLYAQLPHEVAGIGLSNYNGVSRIKRFFYAQNLSSSLCWIGQAVARLVGYVVPIGQPAQSDSMIGLMLSGLKTYNGVNLMTKFHAQEPTKTNTQNLAVSETKQKSLQKQHEIIQHSLNIFGIVPSPQNRDLLKQEALELIRMLDDLASTQSRSRFNVLDKAKNIIATYVPFDVAIQQQEQSSGVIKYAGMAGGTSL